MTKIASKKKMMLEIRTAICRCTMNNSDEEMKNRLGESDG